MNIKKFLFITDIVVLFFLSACYNEKRTNNNDLNSKNNIIKENDRTAISIYKNTHESLRVPTHINKINEKYFIVDCYNNQVIYSDSLENPISEWYVLTDDVDQAHTIVSDGEVYLIDDTENNRVIVYMEGNDSFVKTQILDEIGNRPHCILYDEKSGLFYVLSSGDGRVYIMEKDQESIVKVKDIKIVDPIIDTYTRSFTIIDDKMYFASNTKVVVTNLKNLKVTEEYMLPHDIAGAIQINKIGKSFYLTVSTNIEGNQDYATMIKFNSFKDLEESKYEEVYNKFAFDGTPYYISQFDGYYYLVEHRNEKNHSVWEFEEINDEIVNFKIIY